MRTLPQNTQQIQHITSREKIIRLNNWLSKLSPTELAEHKAGMSDQRRYTLRIKYSY